MATVFCNAPGTPAHCSDCAWRGLAADVEPLPADSALAAGAVVPVGSCPVCLCWAYVDRGREEEPAGCIELWAEAARDIAQKMDGTPPRYQDALTLLDAPVVELLEAFDFSELHVLLLNAAELRKAAAGVVATWERGDLAAAVRQLEAVLAKLPAS